MTTIFPLVQGFGQDLMGIYAYMHMYIYIYICTYSCIYLHQLYEPLERVFHVFVALFQIAKFLAQLLGLQGFFRDDSKDRVAKFFRSQGGFKENYHGNPQPSFLGVITHIVRV